MSRADAPAQRAHTRLDRLDVAVLIGICLLALAHAAWFNHTADDAFISFRYADNWVRGYGLVFNPGERVMGYSNFLWVVLLYPFALVGVPLDTAGRVLGTLLAWATLIRIYVFAREEFTNRTAATAAVVILASSGSFALWMYGGLECHLLALLITIGVTGALQITNDSPRSRFIWLGVVFGLASISHPEPIMYVAPTAAWLWLHKLDRTRFVDVAIFGGVAASFLATLSLWAWLYYGDPLPNTYYAKALPLGEAVLSRGVRMTRKFLEDYRWVPAGVIAVWFVAVRGSLRAHGWLPLALIGTFILFFLSIGGDMLQYHRMWVPMLPMFALLLAETISAIRRPAFGIALGALAVSLTLPNSFSGRSIESLRKGDQFLEGAHHVGERLAKLPDATLIAANNIGIIGYKSHLRILDMMGLTDAHIAHASGKTVGIAGHESHDGAYVLDRKPDIIILGMPRAVTNPKPAWDTGRQGYPSDMDLRRDPRFAQEYELRYLDLADGRWSPVFVRRGFVVSGAWEPGLEQ